MRSDPRGTSSCLETVDRKASSGFGILERENRTITRFQVK